MFGSPNPKAGVELCFIYYLFKAHEQNFLLASNPQTHFEPEEKA